MIKNLPANAGHMDLTPGLGISPGIGNGNPLQYSCLENSMDRRVRWARVHGVTSLDMTEWLAFSISLCILSLVSYVLHILYKVYNKLIYVHIHTVPTPCLLPQAAIKYLPTLCLVKVMRWDIHSFGAKQGPAFQHCFCFLLCCFISKLLSHSKPFPSSEKQ